MLTSQAALRESTGNFEMLVFHTLSAGNIGQLGAPGTTVVMTGDGERIAGTGLDTGAEAEVG